MSSCTYLSVNFSKMAEMVVMIFRRDPLDLAEGERAEDKRADSEEGIPFNPFTLPPLTALHTIMGAKPVTNLPCEQCATAICERLCYCHGKKGRKRNEISTSTRFEESHLYYTNIKPL